jgi:hypothetical protein
MNVPEQERRDGFIIPIILIIGFLFVIIAGQWALRFSPSWKLNTNMDSNLDPNSDFLTRRPSGFIEPVDASILTQPAGLNLFLTPDMSFVTGTRFPTLTPASSVSTIVTTIISSATMTNTSAPTASPTLAWIFPPSTPSSTSKPKPTKTSGSPATDTPTPTVAFGFTPTDTSIPTATETSMSTSTATPTATSTSTATPTATQTPAPVPTDPTPGSIGTAPDGIIYNLPSGGMLTLGITLVVNGHPGWDLVYYERPAGSGVFLDWVIVEISDGTNWYTIFNWGNNVADTNTNMDFNILSNPQVPEEPDQRDIQKAELYNSTGIAIDLDSIVPPGAYPYIRFIAPPGDVDNQMEIDAIQVLP